MNDYLKEKLAILPDQPGCYLMKDKYGTVIYVGKAKVLKIEYVPTLPDLMTERRFDL